MNYRDESKGRSWVKVLRDHSEIVVVLVLFILLGGAYSIVTPLFEAPDEQWHFAFVQSVATGRGLPVQTVDKPTHLARQEGSQPPLYYLLAAGATFWIDTSDYPGIIWENPHYGYNVPGIVNDNKNLFIHTALEAFPYHGAVLAIHIARLVAVLMGALAVLFTYRLTLEIFPGRKSLAAAAGAAAGFVPQFLFVSGAVSNDSTIVAMSALSLWMMARLLRQDRGVWTRDATAVVALGAATGLAALAKVSGVGLALLGGLVLVYVFRRDRKRLALYLVAMGTVVFVIAGWWYLRNWFLYGELTGTAMMVRIFGARQSPLTTVQLLTQLNEVWETFWVGFGWGNIRANPAVYFLFEILMVLSGTGLLVGLVRRRARLKATVVRAIPLFVLGLWVVIAFLELVQWMETTQAPHGRLLFPILPALAPFVVFGLLQWLPRRTEALAARAMAIAPAGLALAALFAVLQPAYAYPVSLSVVPKIEQPVDLNFGNRMRLLGLDVSPSRVQPGGAVMLSLYWQSLAAMDEDYSIGIHLLDANQRVIGSRDSYPGHGLLPTRLWRPGQIIRDTYWLPVAADAAAPGIARINVALYTREGKRDLPALDPGGNQVTPVVGRLKITGTSSSTPKPQNESGYNFGNQVRLIGYDLPASGDPGPGQKLVLYWKRVGNIATDYTLFLHILDSADNIVAQIDQPPGNGENPTSLWDEGEIVTDSLTLPATPPNTYRIEIGLYDPATGERLPVSDAKGNPAGDHMILGSVHTGK